MNIYRVIEDDGVFCIKANTMMEAVKVCEDSYLEEAMENTDAVEHLERTYYHENILQSCEFAGELKN